MYILMILVFSSVLLVFMIYPAIKIVELIEKKFEIGSKTYDMLTVSITIILSLLIGIGLYYL